MVSWSINNQRRYSLSELFSGRVRGYNSSGNNLIVKDIMMNDPRDGDLYWCWISTDGGITYTPSINRFLIYIAGEYQCMNGVMYTTVFTIVYT